ncbi:MAG: hypothetical protein ACXW0Z_16420 [Gemmatirosa sp.]
MTADNRPPLLAFGLGWDEGAPMARVLGSAPSVPHREIPSPLPPPRFPLGCAPAAELPVGAGLAFGSRGLVDAATAR